MKQNGGWPIKNSSCPKRQEEFASLPPDDRLALRCCFLLLEKG